MTYGQDERDFLEEWKTLFSLFYNKDGNVIKRN